MKSNELQADENLVSQILKTKRLFNDGLANVQNLQHNNVSMN